MSVLAYNNYRRPWWLFNAHVETIYPAIFRKVKINLQPEFYEIETRDGDLIELDYYPSDSENIAIISHGLEGNSKRPYVLGMVEMFVKNHWRVIAWNYRTCGTKMNRTIRSYHSGFTQDLEEVVEFALTKGIRSVALIGFSLGGNLTLKYLGANPDKHVKAAATISVPLDLHQSALEIDKRANTIYSSRFLKSLKRKMQLKSKDFPDMPTAPLRQIRSLIEFDDHYTAPIHGFRDALDYYKSCSSISALNQIKTPSLIINALNDPFLPPECYPHELLQNHKFVHLLTPLHGGHVGFCDNKTANSYWSEQEAFAFIESVL